MKIRPKQTSFAQKNKYLIRDRIFSKLIDAEAIANNVVYAHSLPTKEENMGKVLYWWS